LSKRRHALMRVGQWWWLGVGVGVRVLAVVETGLGRSDERQWGTRREMGRAHRVCSGRGGLSIFCRTRGDLDMGVRVHLMTSTRVGWRHGIHRYWLRLVRVIGRADNLLWDLRMGSEWLARGEQLGSLCPLSWVGWWSSRSTRGGLCTREWVRWWLNVCYPRILIRSIDWNGTLEPAVSRSSG
jgi:hypothetical protein